MFLSTYLVHLAAILIFFHRIFTAFSWFIRSSPANVKQNEHLNAADAIQAKQTLESVPPPKYFFFCKYHLEMLPILKFITLCRRCRRQDTTEASTLRHQNTNVLQLLACLAQRLSAFTSRCRTYKAGRRALEPPVEAGARTKRCDREIPVPKIPY